MPKGKGHLPEKAEERGPLAKVTALAPLLSVIIQIFELLLKIFRVI